MIALTPLHAKGLLDPLISLVVRVLVCRKLGNEEVIQYLYNLEFHDIGNFKMVFSWELIQMIISTKRLMITNI